MGSASSKTGKVLREMQEMKSRLSEAEDTLDAIRSGAVDALVVRTPRGEQLFTLKGADQTYRALVEAMSEGAVTLKKGLISYCNHHFSKMAKTPMEHVFGVSVFEFIQADSFRRLIRQLELSAGKRRSIEATLLAADGTRIPVLVSGSRFYSEGQAAVGIVVTDIAERKEAERARQELSRNILAAQEKERHRVARDLHDSVNQVLSSARYRLHSIAAQAGKADVSRDVLQVLELVDKAIAEVRIISRDLRPSELDDLGLGAALRTLTREFEKRTGISTRIRTRSGSSKNRVPKPVEMTLYRIVQESLNNAEKHSSASKVELSYRASSSQVSLTAHDDGRGFSATKKGGSGLQNMNERAGMLGGRLAVESSPGKGTKISVWIPLAKSSQHEARSHA